MHHHSISPREKEVLHLLAYEHNTNEIAQELFISPHTVISHRKNLMCKLDVKNVAGLIRKGFQLNLLASYSLIAICISTSL